MKLNLVNTSSEEDLHSLKEHYSLLHGIKGNVQSFAAMVNKQRHVFSADIYIAMVQVCDDLKKRGLRFIGVVKIVTRDLCMVKCSETELAWKGLWKEYFALDNGKKLDKFAFVWVDRVRRYFIYNTSSLKPSMPYVRDRLRQVDDIPNADPISVEFDINQPRVAERYYYRKSKIDESNCTRQDGFL